MMIQRKKLTIFTDAKDNILVDELKKIISCMYNSHIIALSLYRHIGLMCTHFVDNTNKLICL